MWAHAVANRHSMPEDVQRNFTMENLRRWFSVASVEVLTPEGNASEVNIDPAVIWQIGEKIWQVIADNTPVVNATLAYGGAVPQGVSDWTQLAGWKDTQTQLYTFQFKNGLGMLLTQYQWVFSWKYGANYQVRMPARALPPAASRTPLRSPSAATRPCAGQGAVRDRGRPRDEEDLRLPHRCARERFGAPRAETLTFSAAPALAEHVDVGSSAFNAINYGTADAPVGGLDVEVQMKSASAPGRLDRLLPKRPSSHTPTQATATLRAPPCPATSRSAATARPRS